jgi:hypothetical protein
MEEGSPCHTIRASRPSAGNSTETRNELRSAAAEITSTRIGFMVAEDLIDRAKPPLPFLSGLFLLSSGTLMYEIVLTRLLSVLSWYYLAFVSVSMAMLGMTAGALFVQLRPHLFGREDIAGRLRQFALATAVATPLALVTMLAIPIDLVPSIESLYAFVLFCAVIATPFVFAGIVVCLSLTRSEFAIGQVYFIDLLGAAAGSVGSVALLELLDAPSAIFAISGILFLSVLAYERFEERGNSRLRFAAFACIMFVAAALNHATPFGFGPIQSKGLPDARSHLLAEVWNPISRIRATRSVDARPMLWGTFGNESFGPQQLVSSIWLDIDNAAGTPIYKFRGSPQDIDFLAYDVTTVADQLRRGGSAAIIGVGGGRDLMAASLFNFHRIVGIELNAGIYDLVTRRFKSFANLDKIQGLEIHQDEGRSYLSRTPEKFDVIQASMVDTWAATSAGAMTLSENSLYTVDGWRIFYQHLNPGGIITFTRWNTEVEKIQTSRLFALGWATLISEGVSDPVSQIALVGSGRVATILVSNQPFSATDLKELRTISNQYGFRILFSPDVPVTDPNLKRIVETKTLGQLSHLNSGMMDFSPVYDSSPFFFNSLKLSRLRPGDLLQIVRNEWGGNLRALLFLLTFLVATVILLVIAIFLPVTRWAEVPVRWDFVALGGIVYFVAIGLGFMLTEMAMMQQLSVFLGHPIYSLIVVLTGLTLSTGLGSLGSEQLRLNSNAHGRAPAIISAVVITGYSLLVLPLIHSYAYLSLSYRIVLSLALVVPIGLALGFCFPVGLRWMSKINRAESLPWLWALNGAASVVAGFLAIIISMEASITVSVIIAAGLYLCAAIALPWSTDGREELGART